MVHGAGPLTLRHLSSILPMLDETVVIEPSGAQLLAALENGVSAWPSLEGRFLQARARACVGSWVVGCRCVSGCCAFRSQACALRGAASPHWSRPTPGPWLSAR